MNILVWRSRSALRGSGQRFEGDCLRAPVKIDGQSAGIGASNSRGITTFPKVVGAVEMAGVDGEADKGERQIQFSKLLKILEALHARSVVASSSFFNCRQIPFWIPCSPSDCSWLSPRSACRRRPVQECFGGRWASSSKWSWRSADVPARRTRRKPRRRCTKQFVLVADGVSQPDGISRGPRRRDPSGGSGKAISSGRRRIRGPAHRNPQRQVAAGARTPRTTESAVSSLLPPSIDRCTIVSAEWPGRCALWRSLGLWTIENRTERKE